MKVIFKQSLLLLTFAFLSVAHSYGQQEIAKDSMQFFFRTNSDLFMKDYRTNSIVIDRLQEVLTNRVIVENLDFIVISAKSSPDGNNEMNQRLAYKRSASIKSYIAWKLSHIDQEKIKLKYNVSDWFDLKDDIKNDINLPHREKVLSAISNDVGAATIEWRLRRIGNGESFSYIVRNYLWRYKAAVSIVYYLKYIETPLTLESDLDDIAKQIEEAKKQQEEVEKVEVVGEDEPDEPIVKDQPIGSQPIIEEYKIVKKPLFALKTNLLFDLASLINVEIEVPIGKRWSIAGEWIFPWWTFDNGKENSNRSRIQLLNANLEGRYWFGNRDNRPVMTGWFAGLYVGGGLYDFEYKAKGYQGEFFIAGGLSGGYAHTINKSGTLRMEYSLGIGYMQTDYRKYEAFYSENHQCEISKPHNWHPVRQESGKYTWIGPTRAKVSLVWMLNKNHKLKIR